MTRAGPGASEAPAGRSKRGATELSMMSPDLYVPGFIFMMSPDLSS